MFRIGHGYDLHRLDRLAPSGEGKPLVIGGVAIQSDRGPIAHSDGDALLHAVTDALLGALALPDVGQLFPDDDPAWEDANSLDLLQRAMARVREQGYRVGNLDATVILEAPRLGKRKQEIREVLADALDAPIGAVNVKGKSHEGVDAVGERRAIEAHAVVLLVRNGGG